MSITRHHPAFIRAVLQTYHEQGGTVAVRTHDVSLSAVHKWLEKWRTQPDWCRPAYDADWESRQALLARNRRYRIRAYVDGAGTIVNAIGMRRRLQALYAMGWTWNQLGDMLGLTRSAVHNLGIGRGNRLGGGCHRDTHNAVVSLYDRISMTPPPETWMAERTRGYARRHGFVPPLAWDDHELDDPDARPHVPLSKTYYKRRDLISEYEYLSESGENRTEILRRLGVTWDAVEKAYARSKKLVEESVA